MGWNWITPRLALGSAPSASDVPTMLQQGITDVLDLRGEPRAGEAPHPELYTGTSIDYHYLPMLDRGGPEPVEAYQQGVGIIQSVLSDPSRKILVHCAAGISRSPSMVYAYLRSIGYTPGDAWSAIVQARPVADRQYVQYAENAVPSLPKPGDSTGSSGTTLFLIAVASVAGYYALR